MKKKVFLIFQELDVTLPILTPDHERIKSPPDGSIQVTWIGHATLLIQMVVMCVTDDYSINPGQVMDTTRSLTVSLCAHKL